MFLPNFNRIEWKMEKQQLFQNRLFLALFILTWEKYDVIVTSLLIWFGFFHLKLLILSESISVQNLSSLTLKTKELWKGGGKHPPPPVLQRDKPSAYRVKNLSWSLIKWFLKVLNKQLNHKPFNSQIINFVFWSLIYWKPGLFWKEACLIFIDL